MKNIPFALLILYFIFGAGTVSFRVDPDKPDLRECNICKGNTRNYTILNVYFSDLAGVPNIICGDTNETLYISILYSSNSKSAIHNVRVIADILKKDRSNPDGDPISQFFINEYSGTVNPCPEGTCIFTIPLPIDFSIDCANEFYELSQPLVAWTPQNGENLEDIYICQNYPNAQCLNQPTIPIEVGELSYTFEPIFDCFLGDVSQTNVSFVITSLFGGNPTLPYSTDWEFSYPGTNLELNEFNPVLLNMEAGTVINASLTISQETLIGGKISQEVTVPLALAYVDVIQDYEIINADEGTPNGIIDVTFLEKNLFYFWTSPDEESFYSEDSRIENLPAGTYVLTTTDNTTGTCRTDFFDISSIILPVNFVYHRAYYEPKTRISLISWATGKEWEFSHFEIERADQGLDFEKIGEVNAAGWSDVITAYNFEDSNIPLSAGSILYRIKQVDLNDEIVYSSVMSIRTPEMEATKGVWRAYPNPINGGQLRIGLLDKSQYREEKISFRLIHPTWESQLITVASEDEMNEALASTIGHISKGVFVIEIQWGQKVEYIKVLNP